MLKKILIIDDDEIVLLIQGKLLQRCGINSEIHTFRTGQNALAFLNEQPVNEPLLLLLDINMPVMNGWQFLSNINRMNSFTNLYVIMVTSSIDIYDKEAAAEYTNVIGFIEKPITIENCEKIKSYPELKAFFKPFSR